MQKLDADGDGRAPLADILSLVRPSRLTNP